MKLHSLKVLKHKVIRYLKRQKGLWLDRLGFYSEFNWKDYQPVFIVSTGRTGTTFLGRYFFDKFENVTSYHEPQPDFFDLSVKAATGSISIDCLKRTINANRKWVLAKMQANESTVYIESNYYLFSLIKTLEEIFEEPRFIHVVRDGRDVIRSAYNRQWFRDDDNYDRIKANFFPSDPYYNTWKNLNRFEKLTWYWQKIDKTILRSLDNNPNAIRVYFEDIFNAQDGYPGVEQMLDFLNLEKNDWEKLMNNKIRSSGDYELPHWAKWSTKQKDSFKDIAGDHLKFHGYKW